eukprot:4663423-Pleurochrysis_carterae.AAC.4
MQPRPAAARGHAAGQSLVMMRMRTTPHAAEQPPPPRANQRTKLPSPSANLSFVPIGLRASAFGGLPTFANMQSVRCGSSPHPAKRTILLDVLISRAISRKRTRLGADRGF